jgi:fused signal recognition particle receptor
LRFAGGIFPHATISIDDLDSIEVALYRADFGRETVEIILGEIRAAYRSERELRRQEVVAIAQHVLRRQMEGCEGRLTLGQCPEVICLIGSNGSGKTTTVAKLAHRMVSAGHSVLIGACDTFRAAAHEQMKIWAKRLSIEMVGSKTASDGSSVAYDAVSAAIARKKDVVILDTAGRLHNRSLLMEELAKMRRILGKKMAESQVHGLLIVDGNSGNNSIEQAKAFGEVFPLEGVAITKLDGTSRGGALVGIYRQLHIPIHYVGIGEGIEDLIPFSLEEYLQSLFVG